MATFVPDTIRLVCGDRLTGICVQGHYAGEFVHPVFAQPKAMLEFAEIDRNEMLKAFIQDKTQRVNES